MSGIRTRYAAFIATTNDPLPLTDPTGSRRYFCILTTGKINTSDPIEYDQLYAQLKFEILNSDMKCYFDTNDETEIQKQNVPYQQFDCIEQVFSEIFKRPQHEETGEYLLVTNIVDAMHEKYKSIKVDTTTILKTVRMLQRLKFISKRTSREMEYWVTGV